MAALTQGVYPLNRYKIIHLVRHGQGIHNEAAAAASAPIVAAAQEDAVLAANAVAGVTAATTTPAAIQAIEIEAGVAKVAADEATKAAIRNVQEPVFNDVAYTDANLTPAGWVQVDEKHTEVRQTGIFNRIELVVVSCLLRALQTAVGVFGGEGDVGESAPLMIANAAGCGRPAIPNISCPSFIAVEGCREHLGKCPCDKRRTKSEYQTLFPAVDFDLIETEEDNLWNGDQREPDAAVAARGLVFLKWLFTRPEKEIAVVSHDGFLRHTLELFGEDCDEAVKAELSQKFARVNNSSLEPPLFTTGSFGKDNIIARYGIHGLDWLYNVEVPNSFLHPGNNTKYLTQPLALTPLQGLMYDYIRLEGSNPIH